MFTDDDDYGVADEKDIAYLTTLNKQLEFDPTNYNLLLKKGIWLFYPCLRTLEARDVFDTLIELYPNDYDIYLWYGQSEHVYVADRVKASQLLRKAVSINDSKADALFILALALDMIDNEHEAEIELLLKKAYSIEPLWPSIWDGIISFLIDHKRYQEARAFINTVAKNIPDNYVVSDDIIQNRHDRIISGRSRLSDTDYYLQQFLEKIDREEAVLINNKNI